MQEIVNAITTLGFPIIMCLIMVKYMIDQRDAHKKESEAYRQAIDANTNAITALTTWLQAKETNNHEY